MRVVYRAGVEVVEHLLNQMSIRANHFISLVLTGQSPYCMSLKLCCFSSVDLVCIHIYKSILKIYLYFMKAVVNFAIVTKEKYCIYGIDRKLNGIFQGPLILLDMFIYCIIVNK
jgi:hypothetical protein